MIEIPNWPQWAVRLFLSLGGALVVFALGQQVLTSKDTNEKSSPSGEKKPAFKKFQRQYLTVYYIVMLADWMQGTNMYTLYSSYGVDISALFITGFSSSAVFGTVVGLYVDKWGRKLGCVVYLLLEVFVNICEHYNNFPLLLTSRVLGGISTSLLFSAFESWMVSEHRKLGFPEDWLADTFSWASFGNGISAIIAGLLAQLVADRMGEIGPFSAAIALTILALLFVVFWRENYGGGEAESEEVSEETTQAKAGLGGATTLRLCLTDKKILLVGLVNSLFEGAMYSFVFMWVPTLLNILKGDPLPTGLVFSSLMCCISLGGLIFASILRVMTVEKGAVLVFLAGALALTVPIFRHDLLSVVLSFVCFEICVGVFFPCAGTLRAKVIPDKFQGSVMNVFRVPLNILVVTGTKMTDLYPKETCFTVVVSWLLLAAVLQIALVSVLGADNKSKDGKKKK